MLADKELHKMYDLAHALHPDNGVALSVTLDACERITLMRRMQDRRVGSYRLRLPEACLPQYCVYLASDAREREQEHPRPGKEARYQPTPDDWLVRYVKFLTRPATERERGIIHKALTLFTPWGCPHVTAHSPEDSVLETHFDGAVARSEWERIHALIDPHCAGLPRLIREYNGFFPHGSTMRLDDPDQTLKIPCFDR